LIVAPIALFALAGCYGNSPAYGPAPNGIYAPARSAPSDNGGGPGPGNVPTNPSSPSGG
jgi:hypothetical protein